MECRTVSGRGRGFTLIELLVVMAIIATLLTIAVPRYMRSIHRSREAVLHQDLAALRESIDRFYGDTGKYPQTLEELLGGGSDAPLQARHLRRLYPDPMTNAVDWTLIQAPNGAIMGVASRSQRAPLKNARFDAADQDFEKATAYGDWQFT